MSIISKILFEYYFNKAQNKFNRYQYDESVKLLDKATKEVPGYSGIYLHKGLALSRLNQYNESLKNIKKAIQIDNNNPVYYFFAGSVCLLYGDYDKAESYFEKSIKLDPQYIYPKQMSALVQLQKLNVEKSINLLRKTGFPNHNEFKAFFIVIVYEIINKLNSGSYNNLKKYIIDEILQKKKEDINNNEKKLKKYKILFKLAKKLEKTGSTDFSINICETISDYDNDKFKIFFNKLKENKIIKNSFNKRQAVNQLKIARLLKKIEYTELAVKICEHLINKGFESYELYELTAECYFNCGQYEKSKKYLIQSQQNSDNDTDTIDFYTALCNYHLSNYKKAIKLFETVFNKLDPFLKNETAYWLAKSFFQLKNRTQSILYFSIAFESVEEDFFQTEVENIFK